MLERLAVITNQHTIYLTGFKPKIISLFVNCGKLLHLYLSIYNPHIYDVYIDIYILIYINIYIYTYCIYHIYITPGF